MARIKRKKNKVHKIQIFKMFNLRIFTKKMTSVRFLYFLILLFFHLCK